MTLYFKIFAGQIKPKKKVCFLLSDRPYDYTADQKNKYWNNNNIFFHMQFLQCQRSLVWYSGTCWYDYHFRFKFKAQSLIAIKLSYNKRPKRALERSPGQDQGCSEKILNFFFKDFNYRYIGKNELRTLSAMFFDESGQKCHLCKRVTQ